MGLMDGILDWRLVLAGTGWLTAALIAGATWVRVRRVEHRLRCQIDTLTAALATNEAGTHGVGKALGRLEQRLGLTNARQLELEQRDLGQYSYRQAAKLANMGASDEELVESCGLSAVEARLVRLLNQRPAVATANVSEALA
ncbi:MAG: DUF2802 domain-containing protein [Pseudomonadota bacterium]|nr:DUF2802 domain-containing protein [Pseudomonadota bacterium]